ncbi:tRNA (guanosine(46)-N7)-methyltransferase TrmB [Halalkalibaculum sp. DA3122]|uniref:tRNA (guanosine(46)-N7)-methyltransferase TrmB n=1 Tax=unclassified Halalkalibaculum TaxID=2964617 RepID=UPI003753F30B
MGKNKLERFAEIAEFEHVMELTDFQEADKKKPKGRWSEDIFENDHPITLELACGKGEYTLELARRNPGKNYIGIDIKGARIWKGAKRALERELSNVRFLRIYIDHLDEYFAPGEVEEIWITFPDPYPKWSDRNKRLTAPKFLAIYQKVLKEDGLIHFKTDSDALWDFSKNVIRQECRLVDLVEDVYQERADDPLLTTQTYYEKKHLENGKTIKYMKFRLPRSPIR